MTRHGRLTSDPVNSRRCRIVRGPPLKIAIVGTRGIPNRYGGFEQFAEKVSSTLADRGHEVTVYCRKPFTTPDDVYDRRVRRVILPSIHQKHLDTWSSGLISTAHVAFSDYDVVLLCNVANSPFAWFPRLFGKPVVLNVDGLDRQRGKWNALGQAALHFCEWLSVFTPTRVVTDAKPIQDYYRARYRKDIDADRLRLRHSARRTQRRTASICSRGATCCTSAVSSRRTIPNSCSLPGARCAATGRW